MKRWLITIICAMSLLGCGNEHTRRVKYCLNNPPRMAKSCLIRLAEAHKRGQAYYAIVHNG